jgi:hypothetical protein
MLRISREETGRAASPRVHPAAVKGRRSAKAL